MSFTDIGLASLVVGLLALLLPLLDRDRTIGRLVPCALCAALMLRQLAWRVTESLPAFEPTFSSLWAYSFVSVEIISTIGGLLFLFFISRNRDRRGEAAALQSWLKATRPRVEVFIATYNEDAEILERTIIGAASQTYDNARVWVLDDGRRDWLRDLCDRRSVGYITRPDNAHAKAGNMNHALRHVEGLGDAGEFIAILDADFVAQPDFLSKSVALFHDPAVGCVQTPQHFFNADPLQHGFKCGNLWPDEQRFFFDTPLASKDAWNVAFSCGTSSVVRVAAVKAIDGFPTESVTEDMLLSVKLKTQGWTTAYLNERLSMGLAPEGLREYVTQRGRWCLGFMQIFRSKWGPFGSQSVSMVDRLAMIDAFFYWGCSFAFRIACLIAPIIYLFTGATIMTADASEVFSYVAPTILTQFIVFAWLSRGRCLPILSDVSQLLIATTALRATAVGLFGDRNQKFVVTAKGGDRSRVVIQWRMMAPFLTVMALLIAGLVLYALNPPFDEASSWNVIWIFWAYYSLLVLVVACVTCVELPRDGDERFRSDEVAILRQGPVRTPLKVAEIWPTGARSETTAHLHPGENCVLEIETVGDVPAIVTSVENRNVEFSFATCPALRERMLLKLFSGKYRFAPEHTAFVDVIRGVSVRLLT